MSNFGLLLAIFCCIAFVGACTKEKVSSAIDADVQGIGDGDGSDRERIHRLKRTIRILKGKGVSAQTRREAIEDVKKIGENRQVDAIPVLIEALLLVQPSSINNIFDFEETYPVINALENIGMPAVGAVQERILSSVSSVEQVLLLYTLYRIMGGGRWQRGWTGFQRMRCLSGVDLS